MPVKTYTLNDLKKPDANFFNMLDIEGNDVRLICRRRNVEKNAKAVSIEFCVDAPPFSAGSVFRLPISDKAIAELPDGNTLAVFEDSDIPAVSVGANNVYFAFDPVATLAGLLNEEHINARRPLVSKIPFDYHRIPGPIRMQGHKIFGMKSNSDENGFPAWPIETAAEALRALLKRTVEKAGGACGKTDNRIWPNRKKFAIAISHDLDTDKSFPASKIMADIEESRGLRSCWNVTHSIAAKDNGAIETLFSAGHEIGLHGDVHDNKIAYLNSEQIRSRLDGCAEFIQRYKIRGFRSPSLLTSPALEEALSERFLWSSSAIDSDINSVIAPRRGVCSIFPFFKGRLLEIPLTIPFDDRLMTMGIKGDRFIEVVMNKLDWIAETGGLAFLGNHPEPHISGNPEMLKVYERIIDAFTQRKDAWIALPSDIASFWNGLYCG